MKSRIRESQSWREMVTVHFHKGVCTECLDDTGEVSLKKFPQFLKAHITDPDQQQFLGATIQKMGEVKVGILGDKDPSLFCALGGYFGIGSIVALSKFEGMNSLMPRRLNESAKGWRQLRVDQELHASSK